MKQVIVCRTDLGMGKGKMAGQVAHAAVAAFAYSSPEKQEAWFNGTPPQTKIVLRASSQEELEEISSRCTSAGLVVVAIRDAGRTQLEPGTMTCVAIGPDDDEKIAALTGTLKLL